MATIGTVNARREENLAAFEETLRQLDGVSEETFDALRAASCSGPGNPTYPRFDDGAGIAAYQAAALAALAAAVLDVQNATAS